MRAASWRGRAMRWSRVGRETLPVQLLCQQPRRDPDPLCWHSPLVTRLQHRALLASCGDSPRCCRGELGF